MDSKTFFENFETIANAPGGIVRLRELILDLAVRGKLIPQAPNQKIVEVEWDLGSLKLDEKRIWGGELVEGDPATWTKVPMAALGRWGSGGTPTRGNKSYYGGKIPWLVIGDLNDGLVLRAENHISKQGLQNSSASIVPKGAVFVAMYGSIGKSGIAGIECATNQAIAHCIPNLEIISTEYLFRLVLAIRAKLFSQGRGLAQQNISQTILKHLMVALPPIAEQQRIVAKVDELMLLCDELEEVQNQRNAIRTAARKSAIDAISTATTPEELDVAWKRISGNWLTIADTPESIASLRSLILDLAMKGELVPKSSEWRECLLGEITKIRTGKLDANASSPDGIYPFFTCARDPLRISSFSYDTECVLLAGNGNFDVNYYSGKFDAYQRTYILEARDRAELSIPFLYRFMQGHSRKLLEQSIGGVIKYIKIGFLTEAKFLLPQMEEQKMIVSKVDELMELCDQLEHSLVERNELTKKIAGSLASEVTA